MSTKLIVKKFKPSGEVESTVVCQSYADMEVKFPAEIVRRNIAMGFKYTTDPYTS